MPGQSPDPLTLAIEMSNPSMWDDPLVAGEVAVGMATPGAFRLLGAERITQQSPRDDALAPTIDRLLRRLEIRPAQLQRIAVSGGPGGFTSVRIAVTTAKTIAEAVGAGVVVVPTAEALASAACSEARLDGTLAVLLAGKRETAWCAVYPSEGWRQGGAPSPTLEQVCNPEEFRQSGHADTVAAIIADAHAPEGFIEWAEQAGARRLPPRPSAETLLRLSGHRAAVDPAEAAPIYPREPEAVTKWRERSSG